MPKCIECDKPADWTRHTQFAGDHPYCDEHAHLEKDFGENDSYTFWSSKKERQEKLRNIIAGEAVVEDFGGYEESTHEKQAEFARKRNYEYKDQTNP